MSACVRVQVSELCIHGRSRVAEMSGDTQGEFCDGNASGFGRTIFPDGCSCVLCSLSLSLSLSLSFLFVSVC